jgi:alpha-tubulin suppressor-like RCC1 family protein
LRADDVTRFIRVTVTWQKSGNVDTPKTATTVAVAEGAFDTTPTPTISGTAKVGETLTAHPGTWTPAADTFTYTWLRADTAGGTYTTITGVTTATYTLQAADLGKFIKITVTGSADGYGSVAKTSDPTVAVAERAFDFESISALDVSKTMGMGFITSCMIDARQEVYCWGSNAEGRLGDGTTTSRYVPTKVLNVSGAIKVAHGGQHTCALTDEPALFCWGRNSNGQLGIGSRTSQSTAQRVSGLAEPSDVFLGGTQSCAVERQTKAVKCWGSNLSGEIGDGTLVERTIPATVVGIANAASVSGGGNHTCYLSESGTVGCWGANEHGQLGQGTRTDSLTPVSVPGLDNVIGVSAAGVHHTCALKGDGSVWCWGGNTYGQLGDGTTIDRLSPVRVPGIDNAVQISIDAVHSCARLVNRDLLCWGDNSTGRLGDGTLIDRSSPTKVVAEAGVVAVEAANGFTCAIFDDRKLRCWGDNSSGQLGTGDTVSSPIPIEVAESPEIITTERSSAAGSALATHIRLGGLATESEYVALENALLENPGSSNLLNDLIVELERASAQALYSRAGAAGDNAKGL